MVNVHNNSIGNYGWICPKCGRGINPIQPVCPYCPSNYTYPYYPQITCNSTTKTLNGGNKCK